MTLTFPFNLSAMLLIIKSKEYFNKYKKNIFLQTTNRQEKKTLNNELPKKNILIKINQ